MSKWEYKVIDSVILKEKKIISSTESMESFEIFLNKLGKEGWEIIDLEFEKIGNDVGSFYGLAKRKIG
ncbi:MAG: DUF4177 domain-containing protein [Melioribacteraceae bacterium]|nr:DUF4177 domain-containing protein [Melioribacteraceae bacterium]